MVTTPTAWTEFDLIKRWNINETYKTGDPVTRGGLYYTSKGDSNLGNDPALVQASWLSVNQTISNRNFLINADRAIDQRAFGGGQPAAGVYGQDRWKGDTLGTRIEQVVENTVTYNESFTISWVGGAGTADVDGVTGLSSGDTFTLNTSANFSVIVPTDAADIQVEKGSVATPFRTQGASIGDELALCQRYYETGKAYIAPRTASTGFDFHVNFKVNKRATPTMVRTGNAYSSNEVLSTITLEDPEGFLLDHPTMTTSTACGGSWTADAEL